MEISDNFTLSSPQGAENRLLANRIAVVVILLMAIGTVFVFSASANVSYNIDLQKFYTFPAVRQILFFPLACAVLYTVSCINYRLLIC